jgi:Fic family protein
MARVTGQCRKIAAGGEPVRAFLPHPLPPKRPALAIEGELSIPHTLAAAAVQRLSVAAMTVPSLEWFLYGFVRKEAVISSQIEGTQATLEDLINFEVTNHADHEADVEEVCNYVAALEYARAELARPKGLPLCSRLLCQMHKKLMRGVRGAEKQPGEIRTSQNWIGGTRPGNAAFVPPPPDAVPGALAELDRWIHRSDGLPPLVRAGLAHAQFETIHPFLDGNGRIGRLLITLLVEHWKLLDAPLLYLSLAFKRHREEYYQRLSAIRTEGDWEGWTLFFLNSVIEAADDAVTTAQRMFKLLATLRRDATNHPAATVTALRLFEILPSNPMVTSAAVTRLLDTTMPTAAKAIDSLVAAGVLEESTGKRRDRVYRFRAYLELLNPDTELPAR